MTFLLTTLLPIQYKIIHLKIVTFFGWPSTQNVGIAQTSGIPEKMNIGHTGTYSLRKSDIEYNKAWNLVLYLIGLVLQTFSKYQNISSHHVYAIKINNCQCINRSPARLVEDRIREAILYFSTNHIQISWIGGIISRTGISIADDIASPP